MPNTEEIKAFFESWEIYQKIISHNYMMHREIEEILRSQFKELKLDKPAILEIGCGDSHIISRIAPLVPIKSYLGIDLSHMALDFALKNLQGKIPKIELRQGEMLEQVAKIEDAQFDLIIAGYTIHHLDTDKKTALLSNLETLLSPHGALLIYDVLTREGESNAAHIKRSLHLYETTWTKIAPEQIASLKTHVQENDLTESWSTWQQIATQTSLPKQSLLYTDPNEVFGLMRFQR
ncbi:MAG: class I SAM-dependent methyltransferase [Verrucomicrobiota bacterium]